MILTFGTDEKMDSELALQKSICMESFYEFLKYFWDEIIPEKPHYNWHVEYLCDELQKVAENLFQNNPKLYDLVINISPGTTKSTIASVMFPAWVWTRMASARMICGSYTETLALELSRKCRDIIQCDKYREMFPEVRIRDDHNTKTHYVNTRGGDRFAVGTNGSVTGRHGHFLIIDDPIDPEGAHSKKDLERANRWMNETLHDRKVDKEVSVLILIMQRLHQDDPSGNRLARKKLGKVKHICLPAEETEDVRPRRIKYKYTNKLMDPVRLNREILDAAHEIMGEYGYAGQHLQTPVPAGGGLFRVQRLNVEPRPPRSDFERGSLIRYWDKAGTVLKTSAYTVGVLMGRNKKNQIWVLDVIRGRWGSSEREDIIKTTAEMDGIDVVVGLEQEGGSGGLESATNTVSNLLGFYVEVDVPKGDKANRAIPFSVQLNNRNVYVPRGTEWLHDYLEELSFFPFGKFKDQVDASSGAFAYLSRPQVRIGAF